MKKRDLLKRIEELEQRIVALEARPLFYYQPYAPRPELPCQAPLITWTSDTGSAAQ